MEYAQLNLALTDATQITEQGNVLWDANNFCSPDALAKDGRAAQFRVVPLQPVAPPAFDASTQIVRRDGCEQVAGAWRYKWRVDALTAPELAAKAAADALIAKAGKDNADAGNAKADAKLMAFAAMTPAQVRTWVAANVATLADAKDALATLAVAVSILARRL